MNMGMMHAECSQNLPKNDRAMALCRFPEPILYRNFVRPEMYLGTGWLDLSETLFACMYR